MDQTITKTHPLDNAVKCFTVLQVQEDFESMLHSLLIIIIHLICKALVIQRFSECWYLFRSEKHKAMHNRSLNRFDLSMRYTWFQISASLSFLNSTLSFLVIEHLDDAKHSHIYSPQPKWILLSTASLLQHCNGCYFRLIFLVNLQSFRSKAEELYFRVNKTKQKK